MNANRYIKLVSDFHEAMRHRQPEPRIPDLSDIATNKLRPELIREELRETYEAVQSGNRVEQLDGLCDVQYVLSGSVLDWGFRTMFCSMAQIVDLRKIHDVDAHIAAMLGITAQMEEAARHLFANQLLTHLRNMQQRLSALVYHLGFSPVFDAAFDVVHANNLGKIWKQSDVDEYYASSHAVDGVRFEATKGGYIARRQDGKVLKPAGFEKVTLERFV